MRTNLALGALLLLAAGEARAADPYSLPWQLRGAVAKTGVRSDTSLAFLASGPQDGSATVVSTLLASWAITPDFAAIIRAGVVGTAPAGGEGTTAFVNPVLAGNYVLQLPADLRAAFFLGLALPVGMGGGGSPDPAVSAALRSGIFTRSAMDNAMFAVNDLTIFPGVDLAWVKGGLTVQAEATLLQLIRVRGAEVQPDSARTNFTSGLHVGYFVIPQLSFAAELRYQRWLSTPAAVSADGALRDTLTFAFGPRAHVDLGDGVWLRPGVSFAISADDPMSGNGYRVFQLDVPVTF